MKVGRIFESLVLVLVLAFFSCGCTTNHPLVNTWRNPQFTPSTTNTLALTLRPNPSPEDAELGRMVLVELQRSGFALVPNVEADYLMTYVFSENTEEHVWEEPRPAVNPMKTAMIPNLPLTPQTTSQIFEQSLRSQPTGNVFRTSEYHYKDIRLFLYTNPKKNASGMQLVWQGTITVGNSTSPERELAMLKTLLNYLGKDYNGRVELTR
jgi:hypothetical protein